MAERQSSLPVLAYELRDVRGGTIIQLDLRRGITASLLTPPTGREAATTVSSGFPFILFATINLFAALSCSGEEDIVEK